MKFDSGAQAVGNHGGVAELWRNLKGLQERLETEVTRQRGPLELCPSAPLFN